MPRTQWLLLTIAGLLAANIAIAKQAPSPHRHIVLPLRTPLAQRPPFSDAVLAGNTLYLAGRIGLEPATGKLAATPEAEARNILDGMKRTLAEAGMTMDDLTYVQVYCSDVALFERFNGVYRDYFPSGEFPARAFLGSGKLLFDGHFEVQAIAVRR